MTTTDETAWAPVGNAIVKTGGLIDGTGAPVRMNAFLTIKNGVIQTVSGLMPPDAEDTADSDEFIDLTDYTVLPALIDSHVHLCMSADVDGQNRQNEFTAGFENRCPVIQKHIAQTLAAGVLAVRDGGDAAAHVVRYKHEVADNRPSGFQLNSSGRAFYKPGRYGRIVGGEPLAAEVDLSGLKDQVSTIDQIDQIKLINSGLNSLTTFGEQTRPQFTRDELKAVVRLAKKNKQQVMVHANGETPVREAVMARVSSIEHGFFMGRDNLERMVDNRVFWVPTAVTMKAFVAIGRDKTGVAAQNLDDQIQQMAWAREAGVRIALGTDAGSPGVAHGRGVARELALLREAGYSVETAIQCATENSAQLLGLTDRGTLVPGKQAHFIAVKGGREQFPGSLQTARFFTAGQ